MKTIGYSLKRPEIRQTSEKRLYRQNELETMTTHQLREICRKEKIIHGVLRPLDKEELIRVILRYRGAEDSFLIHRYTPDGLEALQAFFSGAKLDMNTGYQLDGSATITVYDGLATTFYDQITMRYDKRFTDTNALVVSEDQKLCGIFNIRAKGKDRDRLYLVRKKGLKCFEAENRKNYSLYCFDAPVSKLMQAIYYGQAETLPEQITVYRMRILDFTVREPRPLQLPLAIDFGTTNTVAGAYLDSSYFDQNQEQPGIRGLQADAVNYALFYDAAKDHQETVLVPSVVAVKSLEAGKPEYLFGYDAMRLMDTIYTDEGFSIFYDIKRWVGDYEKQEELTDQQGRQMLVPRKELIHAFLEYVIEKAKDRFKCTVPRIHLSCPVKQKYLFQRLMNDILPQYKIDINETLEEGVTVLYNTISEKIAKGKYENGEPQKALIIGCGGGTTDLCSCTYTIRDNRVAYNIDIETTYENGDTNFGGNNLTYRILQILKLEIANQLGGRFDVRGILQEFDAEVYRYVDEHGTAAVYAGLDRSCEDAEELLPTRFQNYAKHNRVDYFRVKENYYYLFRLAEQVKKVFFNRAGLLQVQIGAVQKAEDPDVAQIAMDKWKLSVQKDGRMEPIEKCPEIKLNIYDIELLLRADIYGIIEKFLGPMYEEDVLFDYNAIKLSGQSCKIGLFADAIKEFIPGRIIQSTKAENNLPEQDRLHMKLSCVEGALQYLKDKKYGYANVTITSGNPALPYEITARDHHNRMVTLIHRLDRKQQRGSISRNMDDLTFKLFLMNTEGEQEYSFVYQCKKEDFEAKTYEQLRELYPFIEQDETDVITEREAKFFVWADPSLWGFHVLPVTRIKESLMTGKPAFYPFENDSWVTNFFDGTH